MLSPVAAFALWNKHRHWLVAGDGKHGDGCAKAFYIDNFAPFAFSQCEADTVCAIMIVELAKYGFCSDFQSTVQFVGFEFFERRQWRLARPTFWRPVSSLQHIVEARPLMTGEELTIVLLHTV